MFFFLVRLVDTFAIGTFCFLGARNATHVERDGIATNSFATLVDNFAARFFVKNTATATECEVVLYDRGAGGIIVVVDQAACRHAASREKTVEDRQHYATRRRRHTTATDEHHSCS